MSFTGIGLTRALERTAAPLFRLLPRRNLDARFTRHPAFRAAVAQLRR